MVSALGICSSLLTLISFPSACRIKFKLPGMARVPRSPHLWLPSSHEMHSLLFSDWSPLHSLVTCCASRILCLSTGLFLLHPTFHPFIQSIMFIDWKSVIPLKKIQLIYDFPGCFQYVTIPSCVPPWHLVLSSSALLTSYLCLLAFLGESGD